jgi:small redox-active disulfide protein 2
MKIQVFGSGCPTCKRLYETTKVAVSANGLSIEVEYITDVAKMVEMGLMQSPALVIDGKVAVAGRVPSAKELKEIIAQHQK